MLTRNFHQPNAFGFSSTGVSMATPCGLPGTSLNSMRPVARCTTSSVPIMRSSVPKMRTSGVNCTLRPRRATATPSSN